MPLYSIATSGQLQPFMTEEWLLTNGIGSYAAGTVVACNTRRYHGLLIAATLPPVGRISLLSRIGEILDIAGESQRIELSINQFPTSLHPRGDQYLQKFEQEDTIRWTYNAAGVTVTKELLLCWEKNTLGIRYTIDPKNRDTTLSLLPFVRLLDFHALRRGRADFAVTPAPQSVRIADGPRSVTLLADNANFQSAPDWWFNHVYPIETERGQDDTEDLFTPGPFVLKTRTPATITLWAGIDLLKPLDWNAELIRRRQACEPKSSKPLSDTLRKLHRAANDFIVQRKAPDGSAGFTIMAGYPWFADWGRDTMISLPGLLLCTGKFAQAKQVLCLFAQFISEGMIPNRFDDYTNEPSYNTVNASLWFIHAAFEYARLSGDSQTLEKILRPACAAIIDGYTKGTRYNIRVDPIDGLVSQGDPNTQLTWMDAKCNGVAFTPRQGKAVEINSLWYHALCLTGQTARAEIVAESFRRCFWLSPFRGLADVIDNDRRDASLRPNQIFAVSLPHSPLTPDQQHAVVETVRRELLTPMGLRTLVPGDPKYRGQYRGPQFQRDQAYHNGTVWPWLLGPFLEAYLRVNQRSPQSLTQARAWLAPLLDQMNHGCINQLPEIAEGDPPHRPVGCFAQAWSVAEALRLAVELAL